MTTTANVELFPRLARLRAAGLSWDDAATRLNVAVDELCRVVDEKHREYEKLARRARGERHVEAVSIMVNTLIRLMNSTDPKISTTATTTMSRYELACMRHGDEEGSSRLAAVRLRVSDASENGNTSESTQVDVSEDVTAAKKPAAPPAAPVAPAAEMPPRSDRPAAFAASSTDPFQNASESTEVATQTEVTAAQKVMNPLLQHPLLQTRMTRAEKRRLKREKKHEWVRRKEANRKLAAAANPVEGQLTSVLPEG
jgi:hypothetical protein